MISVAVAIFAALASGQQPDKDFVRDQPELQSLVRWRGGWAAQADRFYFVDPGLGTAVPLEHPSVETVLDVSGGGERSLLFGMRNGKAKLLLLGDANVPTEIPLPAEVLPSAPDWRLVSTPVRAALIALDRAFVCDLPTCHWRGVTFKTSLWRGKSRADAPGAMLLHGQQVFLAVDHGEWGGGLVSLDLRTGRTSLVEADSDPATGVAEDSKGRVWATWGLAHLSLDLGTLRVLEDGRWRLVARSSNFERVKTRNWPMPSTSFEAVALAGERVFILTSDLGVVELVGRSWKRLTPGWERHQYVNRLGISENVAVVGTYDAGLVLWNLGSTQARRIPFRTQKRAQR